MRHALFSFTLFCVVTAPGCQSADRPADAMAQLTELSRASSKAAKGVCAVLSGGSAADRAAVAQAAATDAGTKVYRVDLSRVVSKYVGETEKNLERLFADAEAANALLFFDEADSLFGKRTEVADSKDRYANIETNYLLQRIEQYQGLVVIASNLSTNIDQTFTTRCAGIRMKAPPAEK
jgi:ATP-dependent 26S proteasome regulatory subunit